MATIFLPECPEDAEQAKALTAAAAAELGVLVLGWRPVPVEANVLGRIASDTRPEIEQLFLGRPAGKMKTGSSARSCWFASEPNGQPRRRHPDYYVTSCSCRTIIYKGFCLPEDLAAFYLDLQHPEYTSAIGLFHQRYSTNTLPTWAMAQPFRYIAHNGEINTVQGNRTWMTARTPDLSYADGVGAEKLSPVVSLTGSDSASFDNVVELLYHGDRSLPHALMMMVPEPWEQLPDMPAERRAFYDFHAGLMEQWDGPAAMASPTA